MKHVLSALASVILIVTLTLGSIFVTTTPAPAAAQDTQGCVLSVAGVQVCGTLLGQPLPEVVTVTVPGPTVTLPPVTVTDVVTVRPDPIRVTETIRPAPVRVTETVTSPPIPQPTATVTETQVGEGPNNSDNPEPQATVTVRPNGEPVPTVTETVTPEPEVVEVTGQSDPESGTVEPNTEDEPFFRGDIDLGDDSVSAGEAGVGLLGAFIILGLIFAGMYYGFRRGMAVVNREESYFLRAMLDRNKIS